MEKVNNLILEQLAEKYKEEKYNWIKEQVKIKTLSDFVQHSTQECENLQKPRETLSKELDGNNEELKQMLKQETDVYFNIENYFQIIKDNNNDLEKQIRQIRNSLHIIKSNVKNLKIKEINVFKEISMTVKRKKKHEAIKQEFDEMQILCGIFDELLNICKEEELLEDNLKQEINHCDEIKKEMECYLTKKESYQKELESLKLSINKLTIKIHDKTTDDLENTVNLEEEKHEELQNKIRNFETDLKEINKNVSENQTAIKILAQIQCEKEKEITNLINEINNLTKIMNNNQNEHNLQLMVLEEKYNKQMEINVIQNKNYEEETKKIQTEIQNLKTVRTDKNQERETLIGQLQTLINENKDKLNNYEKKISEMKDMISINQEYNNNEKENVKELKRKLTETKKIQIINKIAEQKYQQEDLSKKFDDLNNEMYKINLNLNGLDLKSEEIENMVEEKFKKMKQSAEEELKKIEKEFKNYQEKMNEIYNNENKHFIEEMDTLRREIETMTLEKNELVTAIKYLQNEISNKQAEIAQDSKKQDVLSQKLIPPQKSILKSIESQNTETIKKKLNFLLTDSEVTDDCRKNISNTEKQKSNPNVEKNLPKVIHVNNFDKSEINLKLRPIKRSAFNFTSDSDSDFGRYQKLQLNKKNQALYQQPEIKSSVFTKEISSNSESDFHYHKISPPLQYKSMDKLFDSLKN